jgi:GT2 family glycosyltransferase
MNNDYPLVALVVPVYNNKEDTAKFLESLKGVTYPNYMVIVIDDGSTDGTDDMVKEKYPYVILLKGDSSLWWAGATNIGIKKAIEMGADYVLLGGMNDTIVDSEFITTLVDTAEKNPRSIVVPKCYCYDEPKKIWQAGSELNWLKGGFRVIGMNEIDEGQYDTQYDVNCATIGMLVNTVFFEDIGFLDSKSFPQYWGDTDFTYRAYKKGYRIIYEPKSIMWHNVSSTVKKHASSNITSFISAFIYLTTNIRSWQNFRTVIKFYSRHCPIYLMPYILMRYALSVILQSMKYNSFFRGFMNRIKTIHR